MDVNWTYCGDHFVIYTNINQNIIHLKHKMLITPQKIRSKMKKFLKLKLKGM